MQKTKALLYTFAILIVASLVAVGCGNSDSKKDNNDNTKTNQTTKTVSYTTSEATDTRVALDRLLAEHAVLASGALQSAINNQADTKALVASLDDNSVALGDVIGSVYGADAKQAFLAQWRAHIGFFVDYATGLAKNDQAMQDKALKNLAGYRAGFANFLHTATGLDDQAAADALQVHVNQLIASLNAYHDKDYAKAYTLEREAYAHMFMTGDALATAIAKQQGLDMGAVTTQAADTRVTLDRLLGEHMLLAGIASEKALSGAKPAEVTAIVNAVDANSVALGDVIGSVYGKDAQASFLSQWRAHIGYHVEYVTGVATNNQKDKDQAAQGLASYVKNFGSFLATATGLPVKAVQSGLEMHVGQLSHFTDQYAAKDYAGGFATLREGYAHMYMLGDTLAEAIVGQGHKDSSNTSMQDMQM